jgi:hypothetical protein
MSDVFETETVDRLGAAYQTSVRPEHGGSSRGGCMKAVYIGLGVLFGDRFGFRGEFHRSFYRTTRSEEQRRSLPEGRLNTIDRMFRALENENVAMGEQRFTPRGQQWEKRDGTRIDSLEAELIDQVSGLPDGSHFFGVSVSDAIHSLLLRLEKTGSTVRLFWMDQFSNGFDAVRAGGFVRSPDVTGRLDTELREIGTRATSVWKLNAP